MQGDMLAAMPPERRIQPLVETIMDREEVADLVPEPPTEAIGMLADGVAGPQATLAESKGQDAAFVGDAEQRSGLQGFDEAGGVA